jgi:cytochrome o ubiquinol oxidase subunit 2
MNSTASLALAARRPAHRLAELFALTKPRVIVLIVFTAVIGMFLATPGMVPLPRLVVAAIGIALVAGAAAATNCLLERQRDALMARTRARPLPTGRLQPSEAAAFAIVLGGIGLVLLCAFVNPLTMWLTLATFAGYAVVYTLVLKPRTPQSIVWGGAAGAMPPVLGWAAATGELSLDALVLFLIVFVWTPPHFWSLALYRRNDYAAAKVPMLPVTHGIPLHAARDPALHARSCRRQPATGLDRHERAHLPRERARARRDLRQVRRRALPPLQRPSGAGDVPLLDLLSRVAVRRIADRPLPAGVAMKRLLVAAVLIALAALSGCTEGVLDPKGPIAAAERQIMLNSTGIMLAIVIPVIVATLGVAAWFRASNGRARYRPDFDYSGRLELLVWSIPVMTVILVGGVAWVGAHDLDPPKPIASAVAPVHVQVVSLDWKWLFIYPDQGVATVNQLVIPVGTPVSFKLTSSGVMNSFFVPQLGGQIYTMAGMVTRLHLQADHAGTYRGLSSQFSGGGFADMRFDVHAVSPEQFSRWAENARNAGPVLDTHAYVELVKPSAAVAPLTYRSVAPDLFDDVAGFRIQEAAK